MSCVGAGFERKLRRLYKREQADRAEYFRRLAREVFAVVDPRKTFDELAAYVRRRSSKLAKQPTFMAELQRLHSEASPRANEQPTG